MLGGIYGLWLGRYVKVGIRRMSYVAKENEADEKRMKLLVVKSWNVSKYTETPSLSWGCKCLLELQVFMWEFKKLP